MNTKQLLLIELNNNDTNISNAIELISSNKQLLSITNNKGQTLLHLAIMQNKLEFIAKLLELGLKLTDTESHIGLNDFYSRFSFSGGIKNDEKTPLDYYYEKFGEIESLKNYIGKNIEGLDAINSFEPRQGCQLR